MSRNAHSIIGPLAVALQLTGCLLLDNPAYRPGGAERRDFAVSDATDGSDPGSAESIAPWYARVNAAATSGMLYLLPDIQNWTESNGCSDCHRSLVLFGAAQALKKGLAVGAIQSQTTSFASYLTDEQTRFDKTTAYGSMGFWMHDPMGPSSYVKGSFAFFSLAAFNAFRGGNLQAQIQRASLWTVYPIARAMNGNPTAYTSNGFGWDGYDLTLAAHDQTQPVASYLNIPGNPTYDRWVYNFPNDGKLHAGRRCRFFPLDLMIDLPMVKSWHQTTALIAGALSVSLDKITTPVQARADSENLRNELLCSLEGVYARKGASYGVHELAYTLIGLGSSGQTVSNNSNVVAMSAQLLSLKPAGVIGWSDFETTGRSGANPHSTGQALLALCLAGRRPEYNAEIMNAIDWLVSQQINQRICPLVNQYSPGCWPQTTFSSPTASSLFAVLSLVCFADLDKASVARD